MMKNIICSSVMALLFAGTMLTSCATSQKRSEQQAQTQRGVAECVANRHWHIDITSMHTLRYGSGSIASDFFLELRGDTLCSYLPYLGQAFQAPLGSPSQGLNFEAVVSNYNQDSSKNGEWNLDMDVKTSEESHHYRVELYGNGHASIRVQSQHRDAISFDGQCSLP